MKDTDKTLAEEIRKAFQKIIYKDGDIYVFYSRRAMNKLINDLVKLFYAEMYKQYFVNDAKMKEITDEDIEAWVDKRFPVGIYNGEVRMVANITGKAFRDGEIKHIQ